MAAPPLIVPTLMPSGALHFAAVQQSATAQEVIDALSTLEGVYDDVLGDLEDNGWAVQKIRRPQPGRPWEEEELRQLGNGKPTLCSTS
jgi:diaphanous 1